MVLGKFEFKDLVNKDEVDIGFLGIDFILVVEGW